jgi:hypothetical protein
MSSYLILYGGGALTLLWWLLNLVVLVWYLLLPRRKISTMCIYAGLLPFILALPVLAFLAVGFAGMGSEASSPGILAYLGDVALTFIMFFGGAILHLWFISIPLLLLFGYGIYRLQIDKLQKP